MKKISIVIPVYNESSSIYNLLEEIERNLANYYDFEIIVVNDCSTDNTLEILKKNNSNFLLKIISNKKNLGQSKSILKGVSEAKFEDIVTPINSHAKLTIKFLKKRKKVLVEKPLLMNKAEKEEILRLNKHQNLLTVSYPYLFSKSLNFVKKIILSKRLGKLSYIEMNIQQCGRFMKYGVNHLLGPHALSILSIFFNIDKIKLEVKNIIKNKNKTETSIVLCSLKKKLISTINLSLNYTNTSSKKIFIFYCDKGTIICDLNNKKKTVISFLYKRIVKKNFSIAKKIEFKSKFYDENNNMKYVLQNFFNSKKNKDNQKLTNKINSFLNDIQ